MRPARDVPSLAGATVPTSRRPGQAPPPPTWGPGGQGAHTSPGKAWRLEGLKFSPKKGVAALASEWELRPSRE